MRDLETMECALRIAETGHLTLATLHTNSAVQTMNRIIDAFPANQQPQVRAQLSFVLEGILCQSLLPRASGKGRCMAMEILVPTPAIRNLIREDKLHQIYSMMQTGQNKYGMQTFNQSLATLVHRRVISQELAMSVSSLPDELAEMIARGAGVVTTTAAGGTAAPRRAGERDAARREPRRSRMAQFVWKGRTRQGGTTGGVLVADSKDLAIADLRRRQIDVTTVKEKGKELAVPKLGRGKVNARRLAIFTRQFSVMIDAGLPLVQCLEILGSQQDNRLFQKIILAVRQDVEAGSSLAEAMRKHPKAFDDLFVNMVAAGEAGGILDTILRRLSTYIEKAVKLKGQVKTALIYPISVLRVAAIVVFIILWKVIPTFASLFAALGAELPLPTRLVIKASNFVASYILFIVAGVRRPRLRLEALLRDVPRAARHRRHRPEAAGPRRHHAEDRRRPLLPHARDAHLLGRPDPRRPRDHGQDRRQRDRRGRDHGRAEVGRGRPHDRRAARRDEGLPADGRPDDRRRRADGRARRDAEQDRRVLRGRGRQRGRGPHEAHGARS